MSEEKAPTRVVTAFGLALKAAIERSDLSLSRLAAFTSTSKNHLSDWINGSRKDPSEDRQDQILAAIARATEVRHAPLTPEARAAVLQVVEHMRGMLDAMQARIVAGYPLVDRPTVPSPDETLADFDAVQAAEAAGAPAPAQKRAGGAR